MSKLWDTIRVRLMNERELTLGSLFDGISAFPLAASRHGIVAKWASEIESFPIKVSRKHFPSMKHHGDVTKIKGSELEPVDIITFGSPCQDLSVAGKQKGLLKGLKVKQRGKKRLGVRPTVYLARKFLTSTRSGLFLEAIRIIREMQEATNGEYPTFAIWENVLGAFSSNGGGDFATVLSKLVGGEVLLPTNKKWTRAGVAVGPLGQVAWRTFDAQFWGVPQRRRRIFLVADFRGERAGEILFESKSLPRDSEQSREAREEAATGVGDGVEATSRAGFAMQAIGEYAETGKSSTIKQRDYKDAIDLVVCFEPRSQDGVPRIHGDVSPTLNTMQGGQRQPCVVLNDQGGSRMDIGEDVCPTLRAQSHNHEPIIAFSAGQSAKAGSLGIAEGISPTLRAGQSGTNMVPTIAFAANQRDEVRDLGNKSGALQAEPGMKQQTFVAAPIPINDKATRYKGGGSSRNGDGSGNGLGIGKPGDPCPTLTAGDRHAVAYPDPANTLLAKSNMSFRGDADNIVAQAVDVRNLRETKELSGTLQAKENGGYSLNYQNPVRIGYRVRRLTPIECLRLMGFPDWWLDIKGTSDSAKYKANGNSIAIPPLEFIFGKIKRIMSDVR